MVLLARRSCHIAGVNETNTIDHTSHAVELKITEIFIGWTLKFVGAVRTLCALAIITLRPVVET